MAGMTHGSKGLVPYEKPYHQILHLCNASHMTLPFHAARLVKVSSWPACSCCAIASIAVSNASAALARLLRPPHATIRARATARTTATSLTDCPRLQANQFPCLLNATKNLHHNPQLLHAQAPQTTQFHSKPNSLPESHRTTSTDILTAASSERLCLSQAARHRSKEASILSVRRTATKVHL